MSDSLYYGSMNSPRWAVFMLIPALLAIYLIFQTVSKRSRNYPDGPKGSFFFGNMFDVNVLYLHLKLTEWSRKYGDFFAFTMASKPVVVLSSPEVLTDLLVEKGRKYSSRPLSSPQAALITQNARIINMQYGPQFKVHNREVQGVLGMHNAKIFLPIQEYESRQCLKNLLNEPAAFWHEAFRFSGSIMFGMMLGCRFERPDDPIPQQIGIKMRKFFAAITPGDWLVDWIPVLDRLPDALAPWRKQAVAIREQLMPFYAVFYHAIQERMKLGTAPDCFVSRLIKDQSETMSEVEHLHLMSDLLTAGTETTATTLQWFFKVAVLFPEAMRRAQEEIDRVVGASRLPGWNDREKLPYLKALIAELHRYASAAPVAFPHATSEADTYRGKSIPANTTIIVNLYGIHRNPDYFPEPEGFISERFLEERQPGNFRGAKALSTQYAFGVGRRECPGKQVAEASLYIMISRILWAFDVAAAAAVPPSGYSGLFPVFGPAKFDCAIRARSVERAQLIAEQADIDRPKDLEDSSIYHQDLRKFMS